jgi:hypothetical protein
MSNRSVIWDNINQAAAYTRSLEERIQQDQEELHGLQSELSSKQATLATLQGSMLQSRDRFQPVEDRYVQQLFDSLSSGIKTLSMKIRQQLCLSGNDLKDILTDKLLGNGVGEKVWRKKSDWKHLLSSFLWRALWETMFRRPFQVYGSEGKAARTTFNIIFHSMCVCIRSRYHLSNTLTLMQIRDPQIKSQPPRPKRGKGGDH